MRKNYYEILGLDEGASESEIKRAYFKLIRTFSPESNPEKFQEIREAYENLKNPKKRPVRKLVFPTALAKSMYVEAVNCADRGDYERAFSVCEEAIRYFPETDIFYYDGSAFARRLGKTGKAVKMAEHLVEKEPDNKDYLTELASAYTDRGFYKNAAPVYTRAYESGVREKEFIVDYVYNCYLNGKNEEGRKAAIDFLENPGKIDREDTDIIVSILFSLYHMDQECFRSEIEKIDQVVINCLKCISPYIGENREQLLQAAMVTIVGRNLEDNRAFERVNDIVQVLREAVDKFGAEEEKAVILSVLDEMRFTVDNRFCDAVKYCWEAFLNLDAEVYDARLAKLDTELCIIEEMPSVLAEFEIIEKEYPVLYEAMKDFINKLRQQSGLESFKDRLLKKYIQRLGGREGYYFELYPQARKVSDRVVYENEEGIPFIRQNKKVGRNDPCPCGSGKKYKHCCGRRT